MGNGSGDARILSLSLSFLILVPTSLFEIRERIFIRRGDCNILDFYFEFKYYFMRLAVLINPLNFIKLLFSDFD